MLRGDKDAYPGTQKRKAEHIAGYEDGGVAPSAAKQRAWATMNKQNGGGRKSNGG